MDQLVRLSRFVLVPAAVLLDEPDKPGKPGANVGNAMLMRFVLTLDDLNRRLILEPRGNRDS